MGRLLDAGLMAPGGRTHILLVYLIDHARRFGEQAPVKAMSIALDVLGRDESFDPSVDSIVRVEVGRLRKLLDLYYSGQGTQNPLHFSIPRGQTRLEALWPEALPARRGQQAPLREHRLSIAALAALALLILGLGALVAVMVTRQAATAQVPRIVVEATEVSAANAALETRARGVSNQLISDLSNFRAFRVVPGELLARPALAPGDFLLRSSVTGTYPRMSLTITLLRGADMSVAWSGRRTLDLSRDGPDEFARMMRELVQRICGPQGVCEADTLGRLSELEGAWGLRPPRQFDCILRFHGFDRSKDPRARASVEACLSGLVQQEVTDAAIWAAQAFMLMLAWSEDDAGTDDLRLAEALRTAARAISIDPTGADGHEVLGSILTVQRRFSEARAALERAAELNPSSPEVVVKLAWIDCLERDWDLCATRIAEQVGTFVSVPGWYRIPLAMRAVHDEDAVALRVQGDLIAASGDPRGLIFSLAAGHMEGDLPLLEATRMAIDESGSSETSLLRQIERMYPDPELSARLSALLKAPRL